MTTAREQGAALRYCAEAILGGVTSHDDFCASLALAGATTAPLIRAIRRAEAERQKRVVEEPARVERVPVVEVRGRPDPSVWVEAANRVTATRD